MGLEILQDGLTNRKKVTQLNVAMTNNLVHKQNIIIWSNIGHQ